MSKRSIGNGLCGLKSGWWIGTGAGFVMITKGGIEMKWIKRMQKYRTRSLRFILAQARLDYRGERIAALSKAFDDQAIDSMVLKWRRDFERIYAVGKKWRLVK